MKRKPKTKKTHAFVISITMAHPCDEPMVRRQLREAVFELTAAFTRADDEGHGWDTYPTRVTVTPIREG